MKTNYIHVRLGWFFNTTYRSFQISEIDFNSSDRLKLFRDELEMDESMQEVSF
jgi:hypothetical protein